MALFQSSIPAFACKHCARFLPRERDATIAFIFCTSSHPRFSGWPGSHPWVKASMEDCVSLFSNLSNNLQIEVGATALNVSASSNIFKCWWHSRSKESQPFRLRIRLAAVVFLSAALLFPPLTLDGFCVSPLLVIALDILDFFLLVSSSSFSMLLILLFDPLAKAPTILVSQTSSSKPMPSSPVDCQDKLTLPLSSALMLLTLTRSWHACQISAMSSSPSPSCSVTTSLAWGWKWWKRYIFMREHRDSWP